MKIIMLKQSSDESLPKIGSQDFTSKLCLIFGEDGRRYVGHLHINGRWYALDENKKIISLLHVPVIKWEYMNN